jgi:histone H3/H4
MARTKHTDRKNATLESKSKKKTEDVVVKRKHRWRSGTKSLMNIRRQQKSTELIIPRAAIKRLIREVCPDDDARFKSGAVTLIQSAVEAYIIDCFSRAQSVACFNQRKSIKSTEMQLTNEHRLFVE